MHFEKPFMLNILWFLPLIIVVLWLGIKHRKRAMNRFIDKKFIAQIAGDYSKRRNHTKSVLLIFVIIFSVLALARPQWGFEWQEIKREGIDILIVLDVSKSMLATDVKPNRLERTKYAVKDLVKKLKGDRIGLMAFAGDAFLICPLTVDYNGFILSLNDLDTDAVPRGGTNLSKAIEEAMTNYDETPNKHKSIIIVTDGDNLEGDPLRAVEKAKSKDIKIYTVGIGTPEGELIQLEGNQFLKDSQGNFVKSRLNEQILQQIALKTGGVYVKASGVQFGLDLLYDQYLSAIEKREIESKKEKLYHERFQYPLAIAVILLLFDTCLTRRKNQFGV